MTRLTSRDAGLLSLTVMLALSLRLWKLDASLWYDEVLTLVEFVRLSPLEALTTYTSLNNHLFFTLQAQASVALFGESAWALRLPAVIFGVATIPVLFLLVRQIGGGLVLAHVSALLLAANYHHIWFSQNARGYTGLIFWCLLAVMAFVEGARNRGRLSWVLLSLAAAAALFTHLSAAFFLLSFAVCYGLAAVLPPLRAGAPGLASATPLIAVPLTAVLVLVLYAGAIPDMLATFQDAATPTLSPGGQEAIPEWRSPLWTLLEVLRSLPLPLPVTMVAAPALLVVMGAGLAAIWRLCPPLAVLIPVSIGVTFALLLALGMRIWPRYFLADLPFLLIMAAAGTLALGQVIGRLVQRPGLGRTLGQAGLVLGVLASLFWATRNYASPKQDFAGAIAVIEAGAAPGDARASFGLAATPIATYFRPDWAVLETAADLDALLAKGRPVWIVYGFADHSRAHHSDIMARIASQFDEVASLPGTLGVGWLTVVRSKEGND